MNKDKKLKRVGLALIILPALSIGLTTLIVAVLFAALIFFPDVVTDSVKQFYESVSQRENIPNLGEIDLRFFNEHQTPFKFAVAFNYLIHLAVGCFVIRIGLAWWRNEAFTAKTVSSLHWIGILTLLNGLYGLCMTIFAPTSPVFEMLIMSNIHNAALTDYNSNGLGSLTTGLLLIALSWVLKHGMLLKEENDLTV